MESAGLCGKKSFWYSGGGSEKEREYSPQSFSSVVTKYFLPLSSFHRFFYACVCCSALSKATVLEVFVCGCDCVDIYRGDEAARGVVDDLSDLSTVHADPQWAFLRYKILRRLFMPLSNQFRRRNINERVSPVFFFFFFTFSLFFTNLAAFNWR